MQQYEQWIGRHIEDVPEDADWPGQYPLIDVDGRIIGITDTQADNDEVIVDWDREAHRVVVRGAACDAAICMSALPEDMRAHARQILGWEDED